MLENEPGSSVTGIGPDRLFTAAPEALVVVRDHRIELANEAAEAFLGSDLVGLEIHELIADWVEGADAGVPFEATVRTPGTGGEPGHDIPQYLQSQGYRIVPVNPRGGEVLGEHSYASLRDIDIPADVVDVFRPPAEAEGIARDAIPIGAKTLWFQPGTHTDEAVALAREAGLTAVAKRCMGVTHGWLGLGPGPHVSSVA